MNLTIENILLVGSFLLFISIIVGKTSYKFGVPTLILFLVIGMLAGSEGIGNIQFNDPGLAQFIGIVSLNFILFSGGLDTNWESVRPVVRQGLALSTIGVILTAGVVGLVTWYLTDFTLYESLLLGSIVSSTDAAAVFSILRSKSIALKTRLRPTLEFESGSNDPVAYVLTIAFLGLVVNPEQSIWSIIPLFVQQMVFGGALGFLFGFISKRVINRIRLDFEGLYPVLMIAMMFITFSATDFVGGNGFLAVYICAVFVGNQDIIHKRTILKMYDGLAWLMQIVLFLTLGLLVNPSEIVPVLGMGMFIAFVLIFLARPIGVFISLLPFKMKNRRRLYISWVGLRGAVPIVFATYPLIAGIGKAEMMFNIVFFVSLSSVLIQGTTLGSVAKWLHVALPEQVKPKAAIELFLSDQPKNFINEVKVKPDSRIVGKAIVSAGIPAAASIAMIKREGTYLTPNGFSVLQPLDTLIVLTNHPDDIEELYDFLRVTPEEIAAEESMD